MRSGDGRSHLPARGRSPSPRRHVNGCPPLNVTHRLLFSYKTESLQMRPVFGAADGVEVSHDDPEVTCSIPAVGGRTTPPII